MDGRHVRLGHAPREIIGGRVGRQFCCKGLLLLLLLLLQQEQFGTQQSSGPSGDGNQIEGHGDTDQGQRSLKAAKPTAALSSIPGRPGECIGWSFWHGVSFPLRWKCALRFRGREISLLVDQFVD